MMPLNLAPQGEEQLIRRIGGSPEVKLHLENLGFNIGGSVTVVSELGATSSLRLKSQESRSIKSSREE